MVGDDSMPIRSMEDLLLHLHKARALSDSYFVPDRFLRCLERHMPEVRTGEQLAVVAVAALLEVSDLAYLRHRSDERGRAIYLLQHVLAGLLIDTEELQKGRRALEMLLAMCRGTISELDRRPSYEAWVRFE